MAKISLRLLSSCAIGVARFSVEASRDMASAAAVGVVAGDEDDDEPAAAAGLGPEVSWLTSRLVDSLLLLCATGGVRAEEGGEGEDEVPSPHAEGEEVEAEVEVGKSSPLASARRRNFLCGL